MSREKKDSEKKMRFDTRKRFIINPGFQYRIMGYVALLCAVVIAILYFANVYFFSELHKTGMSIQLPPNHIYFQLLNEQQHFMRRIFIATSLGVALVVFCWGLILSNQIAGPIYRLSRHIQQVVQGKTDRNVSFRKRDFFPELAVEFNRLMAKMRGDSNSDEPSSKRKSSHRVRK
jgi:HAMP domain-containing protein